MVQIDIYNTDSLPSLNIYLWEASRNRRHISVQWLARSFATHRQTSNNFVFQHDLNEMTAEAQVSEEKAQRAMIDAARLADELRVEQEASMLLERDRRLLEAQV